MPKAPSFDYTADRIKSIYPACTAELEARLREICSVAPGARTWENTALAFEQAVCEFGEAANIPVFMAYVSDSGEVRKAAQDLELAIGRYSVDLFTREDVFKALCEYADRGERLDPVSARLLEKTLLDFRKNGLGLPAAKRAKIKKFMKELIGAELEFSNNLRAVSDSLELDAAELEGMPHDYLSRLKRTEAGRYLVTMDYPDYVPFMDNAQCDDARRRLEALFNNRCADKNIGLMDKALSLRRKISKMLGYGSFADYMLDDRMAKNSGVVTDFLERTLAKLKKKGRRELRARARLKAARTGLADKNLAAWEWRFYNNLLKKTKYSLDHEKIKEYFPLETVLSGMLGIFGEVFGANFAASELAVWHKDVRAYEVKNPDGSTAAYFYFDLFPREGKYKHAACFGIRSGRELRGGVWQTPAAAIVANFPSPGPDSPSLLTFDEVVTLFHEFGHVTHNIFTRSKYGKFSGTSVSRDFVEVPSKMLENWAYCPAVLGRISGHYKKPGEKLPEALVKKIISAKNMDSGLVYLRQLFFSILDMRYHTARGKVDTTGLYSRLMKKISLIPMSPGTHPQASFGHLMGGYEAGYYGYLWAEVIAADLFETFAAGGAMSPEIGARYRELILAPGRSFDEAGQVQKFLGRPAGEDAFLKSIEAAG